MKFGISLSGMAQFPANVDPQYHFAEICEWTHAIRDIGFDYIYLGQHYLSHPYQAFQAVPLLSRLAAETGGMHLGATLIIPLHHPIELAEHLATLDVISGGRFFLSCALGYRDNEFDAFSVSPKDKVSRFVETIQVLVKLWTEEEVTYHGQHFCLKNVGISLKPIQKPHPPIWIAANGDRAIQRAAQLNFPWHINPHSTFQTIQRQVTLYHHAAEAAGLALETKHPLYRELYCAETHEQAWQQAQPYLGSKYETYASWGQDQQISGETVSFNHEFQDVARDRFIIGSPQECIEELERYYSLGVSAAHFRMAWPGIPKNLAIKSMELFAAKVQPYFQDR
ncbi:LLM class flavin-dependent oxidoreductase [Dehalococcoidia bacterium]|nr:LLM class flavin-dependent oxidoreductase [Dehalococcoidia bacterium]